MRSFKHIATLIRLKRITHPKNLSQTDLSLLLGYKNGQFISNVERGLCNVPLKMLKQISIVLNIDPSEVREAILKDHAQTLNNFFDRPEASSAAPKKKTKPAELSQEAS